MTTDLDQLRKMATPTRLGVTVGKEYMGVDYIPYPWMLHAEKAVLGAISRPGRDFIILNVPPQNGKQLDVDTPVPTPTGWTTMGALRVGDRVIASDGSPTRVLFTSPIEVPEVSYRVTFDDGSHLDACADHQWVAGHRWGPTRVVTTAEMAAATTDASGRARWRIPRTQGLDLPPIEVPCDPWFIGYWLGDGARGGARITTADPEVVEAYREFWTVKHVAQYDYSVSAGYDRSRSFHTMLGKLGIRDRKKVPEGWLRASFPQRLALLQGWMDADGYCSPAGQCELACSDPELIAEAHELIRSLGIGVRRYGHRLLFVTNLPVFRLERKLRNQTRGGARRDFEIVRSIERIPSKPMRCITVDHPTGTYLAGEQMHVTHNTTTFGMLLIAWYLGMFPYRQAIFIAYAEEYAATWGLKTRNLLQKYGPDLFGVDVSTQQDSKGNWKMANGFGGMMSVGILGGITGNPGDLIVIDDVIKTMEDAASITAKQKHIDEYDGSISTRFQENTTVLITATRFVEDDLSGRLIERQEEPDYEGDRFHVISIPAIAEAPDDIPEEELEEWRDELGRKVGDGLEGRYSLSFYESRKKSLPTFIWSAVYQQNPSARDGGMFPADNWLWWDELDPTRSPIVRKVRVWDLATTEGGGDWTVGTLMGLGADGDLYVLDCQRFRKGTGDVEQIVKDTARIDGFSVKIIIEQEKAGAGKTVVEHYQRELRGHLVEAGKVDGTKEQRATPYSIMQNQKRVRLPKSWDKKRREIWVDEHRKMMGDGRRPRHDDQIDTGAYGALDLLEYPGIEMFIPGQDELPNAETDALADDRMLAVLVGANPFFGN